MHPIIPVSVRQSKIRAQLGEPSPDTPVVALCLSRQPDLVDAQTLHPPRERRVTIRRTGRLVDWSVRRGDFGLGGLAGQRIVGAFVKLPDAIAIEPLFFHFQVRA